MSIGSKQVFISFLAIVIVLGTVAVVYATTCSDINEGKYTNAEADAYISSSGYYGWAKGIVGKTNLSGNYYIGMYVKFMADDKVFCEIFIYATDPSVTGIAVTKHKPSGQHSIVWSFVKSYWTTLPPSPDPGIWNYDTSAGVGATTAGYCII